MSIHNQLLDWCWGQVLLLFFLLTSAFFSMLNLNTSNEYFILFFFFFFFSKFCTNIVWKSIQATTFKAPWQQFQQNVKSYFLQKQRKIALISLRKGKHFNKNCRKLIDYKININLNKPKAAFLLNFSKHLVSFGVQFNLSYIWANSTNDKLMPFFFFLPENRLWYFTSSHTL